MRQSRATLLIVISAVAVLTLAACFDGGDSSIGSPVPTGTPQPSETASPTPIVESDASSVGSTDSVPNATGAVQDRCPAARADELQDVTGTSASPYFVHHPDRDGDEVATVVFLSGGRGSRRGALRAWDDVLANSEQAGAFRVVLPYSEDIDFIDDARRTFAVVDEILRCFGGDATKVHLGGTSNGGLAAFALMMSNPEPFATLLGAPGAFPTADPASIDPAIWIAALADRPVFNGVGALDDEWMPEVRATNDALVAAGIRSVYVEFPGAGHRLSEEIDADLFYEFWSAH